MTEWCPTLKSTLAQFTEIANLVPMRFCTILALGVRPGLQRARLREGAVRSVSIMVSRSPLGLQRAISFHQTLPTSGLSRERGTGLGILSR